MGRGETKGTPRCLFVALVPQDGGCWAGRVATSAPVPRVRDAGTQGTSGAHFEAPMERHPSRPSLRTQELGYGDTWRREVCWALVATLAFGPHSHAALFAADVPLLLWPGLSQPTRCPGDWGESNGTERCPHRHSPVLGARLTWHLPQGESQGWCWPGVIAVLLEGQVGSAPSPNMAM